MPSRTSSSQRNRPRLKTKVPRPKIRLYMNCPACKNRLSCSNMTRSKSITVWSAADLAGSVNWNCSPATRKRGRHYCRRQTDSGRGEKPRRCPICRRKMAKILLRASSRFCMNGARTVTPLVRSGELDSCWRKAIFGAVSSKNSATGVHGTGEIGGMFR